MNYVYILECSDGSLYTGWTTDIENRIKTHNAGKASKYTRGRTPVTLVYLEVVDDKSAGLKRERAIKKLSLEKKIQLIKSQNPKFNSKKH